MEFSIPTPKIPNNEWSEVYEPSEDTFLLIDALQKDWDFINSKKPNLCLEVGCGSGTVITALASVYCEAFYFSTDINFSACLVTQETSKINSVTLDSILGDLVLPLRDGLVDLVIFNPPYVITSSEEVNQTNGISRSWAGGLRGREVIDRFIALITKFLSSSGFGYLLLLRENDPTEVMRILTATGCKCTKILSRQLRGEFLIVIRFEKIS